MFRKAFGHIRPTLARVAGVAAVAGILTSGISGAASASRTIQAPTGMTVRTPINPQVPVIVAGKRYTPREFTHIAPTIKYFAVPAKNGTDDVMYGYTDRATYDRETVRMDREDAARRTQRATAASDRVTYYEDIYYLQDRFDRGAFENLSDLTKHWAHCGIFGCTADWNDRISSLRTGTYSTVLFTDAGFGGVSIRFGANQNVGDLRMYGWNDRASALIVP